MDSETLQTAFVLPDDVPPLLQDAADSLCRIISHASRMRRNTQKILHFIARCVDIIENLKDSIKEQPSTFEEMMAVIESVRKLEILLTNCEAAVNSEVSSSESLNLNTMTTWESIRADFRELLNEAYHPEFNPPSINWEKEVEDVVRIDDYFWAHLIARGIGSKGIDPDGAQRADCVAAGLLGEENQVARDQGIKDVMRIWYDVNVDRGGRSTIQDDSGSWDPPTEVAPTGPVTITRTIVSDELLLEQASQAPSPDGTNTPSLGITKPDTQVVGNQPGLDRGTLGHEEVPRGEGSSAGEAIHTVSQRPYSDLGHGGSQGHSRVASEAGGSRRGSASGGGSGFMARFFSSLSTTSITSSEPSRRMPPSTPKGGKLTEPNPSAASQPTTWSPAYGLGRGHSNSSSTFFRGEGAPPSSILNVTAPATPESPYVGLQESPFISTVPLRSTSPSPTAKLSTARTGSMYAFPQTESVIDEDLVLFEPKRPDLPRRQSSASAKSRTLAVNQISGDSEFLKEIDDLRRSRQEIATVSRRASFRKTVEGDVAEDDYCSDGDLEEGSDEERVWMKARRAMLTVREMMRTETSYRNHLIRFWEADSANPNSSTPPTFLAHLPSLISASTLLSSRLEEDPSAWGASAFVGAEDALEKAFTAWCGVVGQVMLELAGNTPPISTSASRTSFYNRKSSTGAKEILDKEKPAPKRADTIASSISDGSGSVIMSDKTSKESKSASSSSGANSLTPLSADNKTLSVQDVAIMPSQRVPRYVLLFKDLLEQTPVTSPSRVLVERALQGAMRIAKNCDDARQHDASAIPSP